MLMTQLKGFLDVIETWWFRDLFFITSTHGYCRKLPMSMGLNYNLSIKNAKYGDVNRGPLLRHQAIIHETFLSSIFAI